MISDDFDKIVRQMIEQFFGGPVPMGPDGNATFKFTMMATGPMDGGVPTIVNEEIDNIGTQGPRAERIELEDRIILLIDGITGEKGPTAKVDGSRVTLTFADKTVKPMKFEMKTNIDVMKSSISFRNGVAELNLFKAKDKNAKVEGEIKYE